MGRGLRPRKLITVSPKPTNHHPTFCVAAFAPKLRRQAFFWFCFCCFSNFRKCTTSSVRWPKCTPPPPTTWKKKLILLFQCFLFFLLYVHKDLRKCNGCHLDSGRCGENVTCFGPFSFVLWSDSGRLRCRL